MAKEDENDRRICGGADPGNFGSRIAVGIAIGAAIGAAIGNVGVGIAIGIALAVALTGRSEPPE